MARDKYGKVYKEKRTTAERREYHRQRYLSRREEFIEQSRAYKARRKVFGEELFAVMADDFGIVVTEFDKKFLLTKKKPE